MEIFNLTFIGKKMEIEFNLKIPEVTAKTYNTKGALTGSVVIPKQFAVANISIPDPAPTPEPIPDPIPAPDILSTPEPTPTLSPAFKDALTEWRQTLEDGISFYADRYQVYSSRDLNEHNNPVYYDGAATLLRASTLELVTGATKEKADLLAQRIKNDYQNIFWPQFRNWSQWAFPFTAASISKEFLQNVTENNCYWYDGGLAACIADSDARGLGYYLKCHGILHNFGITPARNQYADLIDATTTYINSLGTRPFELFYMLGILGYYTLSSVDFPNNIALAKKIADYIAPNVSNIGVIKYGVGDHSEKDAIYASLNFLIAPLLYNFDEHKTKAELLFINGVNNGEPFFNSKEWCQWYMLALPEFGLLGL